MPRPRWTFVAVTPGPHVVGRRWALALLAALTAVLLAGPLPALAQYGAPWGSLASGGIDDVARMAEAVNAIRAQNGRTPLKLQPQLSLAAQRHADSMVQTRTLSHTGAGGSRPSDRMRAAGYETCGGGENIAFGALQTVDDVARGWYDSPGHRQIMLDSDVREMGIGRAQTPDGMTYWALEVGQRPPVAPVVINAEAAASTTSSVTVYVYGQISDQCRGAARQVVQVTLANSPDFSDAQTFPYAPTLGWTLAAGEGVRAVYARLRDSSGRTLDAQDEILVSSTAPPPSTASNLSPPVQTYTVQGANGLPTQFTVYRTQQIVPSNASVTSLPCGGSLTGCWSSGGSGNVWATPQSPSYYGAYGSPYGSYGGYGAGGYGYNPYGYSPYGYGTGGYNPWGGYASYAGYGGYGPSAGGWYYPSWPGY